MKIYLQLFQQRKDDIVEPMSPFKIHFFGGFTALLGWPFPPSPASHVSLKFPTSIWIEVASWNDKVKMTKKWKWQSKYIHIFVHLQYLRIWQSYYFVPFYMSCSRTLLPWTWEIVALPHPFCAFTVTDSFPREGAWGVVGGQQSCTKWWTHTHRELVKETHFACVSEEVGCALGKEIFGWKLLNFFSDAQKWVLCIMATLGNLPWGSLGSCWLHQMERDFFPLPCEASFH